MRTLPYVFLLIAGGLSLATFMTSQTLASGACPHASLDISISETRPS